jgi:hypothetical protein
MITLVGKKKKNPPISIQGDSYCFDNCESEYDDQIALSPTRCKGEGIKLKKKCNKQVMYWCKITIHSIK